MERAAVDCPCVPVRARACPCLPVPARACPCLLVPARACTCLPASLPTAQPHGRWAALDPDGHAGFNSPPTNTRRAARPSRGTLMNTRGTILPLQTRPAPRPSAELAQKFPYKHPAPRALVQTRTRELRENLGDPQFCTSHFQFLVALYPSRTSAAAPRIGIRGIPPPIPKPLSKTHPIP